jgi:hypothetical protein
MSCLIKSIIDELATDDNFDTITMYVVLGYIPVGIDYLNMIKHHLKDKGVLFFQVSKYDSLAKKVM